MPKSLIVQQGFTHLDKEEAGNGLIYKVTLDSGIGSCIKIPDIQP